MKAICIFKKKQVISVEIFGETNPQKSFC